LNPLGLSVLVQNDMPIVRVDSEGQAYRIQGPQTGDSVAMKHWLATI
jgi:hypothetical protein